MYLQLIFYFFLNSIGVGATWSYLKPILMKYIFTYINGIAVLKKKLNYVCMCLI